jgi:hypothetical protein
VGAQDGPEVGQGRGKMSTRAGHGHGPLGRNRSGLV